MKQKVFIPVLASLVLFALLLTTHPAVPVAAQEVRPTPTNVPTATGPTTPGTTTAADGSIRGTLYEDTNADGKCGAGDPLLTGIPIQFVSNDGQTTLYLQSGADGTYGLVAAGYGTWQVTADPPAPWVVTSEKTIRAFVGSEQRVALNVNFCLSTIEKVQTNVVLPRAGSADNPVWFVLAAVAGLALLGAGSAVRREQPVKSEK